MEGDVNNAITAAILTGTFELIENVSDTFRFFSYPILGGTSGTLIQHQEN
jgi:hypothetical protein